MILDFTIAQGTTQPSLRATLTDIDGTLIPLDTDPAPLIRFVMRQRGYPLAKVDAVAQITGPLTSEVEYLWVAGDTDQPGLYLSYWLVTYGDGSSIRVPNDEFDTIAVVGN